MLDITKNDGLLVIKFNDPKTKNAIDKVQYKQLGEALRQAATDDSVKVVVITGEGNFYSSGNNIKALMNDATSDPITAIDNFMPVLQEMVDAFIEFPKLLIGLANGPVIGIAATTIAHCDVIYAHESAYFYAPFSLLGLCAEGAGSYTFPKILGKSKAMEMLMLNHKMSANEAKEYNFVSRVYNSEEISGIWKEIEGYTKLPVGSLMATKRLMKKFEVNEAKEANRNELKELKERFMSEEAVEAIINFSTKKSSL